MFRKIDRSPTLSRFIRYLSDFLARQRGLPIVIGIVFIVIGLITQIVDIYVESQLLTLISVMVHSVGLLLALIGLLLADPLGK